MAELLVRAKSHWKDSWDSNKVNSLTETERKAYNVRSQLGDIIVVKPDGWEWGKEECLPNFIVIKLPNIDVKDVKHYEEALQIQDGIDEHGVPIMKILKVRKYRVPIDFVQAQIDLEKSAVNISLGKGMDPINGFIQNIIEKTS
jgi:hypothetical protein